MLQRNFTWVYKEVEWHYNAKISEGIYTFYKNKPHDWTSNYANYALSDQDRPFLQDMANQFKQVGANNGFSQYDDAMIVAIFVQSLPYKDDLNSTGQAEYPRYPLETIVDNGGDCEDKAILASALLHEMGYDVVLLKFPDHMAVGVDLPEGVSLPDNEPPAYYDYLASDIIIWRLRTRHGISARYPTSLRTSAEDLPDGQRPDGGDGL